MCLTTLIHVNRLSWLFVFFNFQCLKELHGCHFFNWDSAEMTVISETDLIGMWLKTWTKCLNQCSLPAWMRL